MRDIRAQFELSGLGQQVDRRYIIAVSDGVHSKTFTLAPPDQFSKDHRWDMLLGHSSLHGDWVSNSDEGMYVTICRQYVNPDFDFSIEQYQNRQWLLGQPDVSSFRLYNPWIGRPFLSWAGKRGWTTDVSFSEGDSYQFAWSFSDWETKIEENDVKYSIQRLDDTNDFKEFIIKLD